MSSSPATSGPTSLELGNVIGLKEGGPTVVNERGDVERGFAESDVVVERFFRQSEVNAVSHEPRACVAVYENDACTLWCSVQDPYRLQDSTARVLACPWKPCGSCPRISAALSVSRSPDDSPYSARSWRARPAGPSRSGSPAKESLDSHNRSALTHYVKEGPKRRLAYQRSNVPRQRLLALWRFGTKYRLCDLYTAHRSLSPLPNVKWEVFAVRTNRPSTGPYRGRADAESHFPIESVMDELACTIQMDPSSFA